MASQDSIPLCWVCGKSVDVTACKTDEYGKAVHEACYAVRIALEAGARKAPASFTTREGLTPQHKQHLP